MKQKSKIASNITQLVKELTYPEDVAEKLVQIVYGWLDETSKGKPFIDLWADVLQSMKNRYDRKEVPLEKLVEIEQIVIRNMSVMIKKEFEFDKEEKCFDLADVVKYKQAQCLSYTILVYILGISMGFLVSPLIVTEIVLADELPIGRGHNACLFKLADGRMMMVDLAVGPIISQPFNLEETFIKKGDHWELIDDQNPLLLNRRFTITDQDSLVACIYLNKGKLAGPEEAIQHYDHALKLNPGYSEAFSNKGIACEKLGRLDEAVSCYDKALELNPKDSRTYYNRGGVKVLRKEYNQAVNDYNQAVSYHKKFPEAYLNRGVIYGNLGNYEEAIFEYNKALELHPDYGKAYFHRGTTFISLQSYAEAIADLTRAIEIVPDFAEAYYNRAVAYNNIGETSKAVEDFAKVKKLYPELDMNIDNLLKEG